MKPFYAAVLFFLFHFFKFFFLFLHNQSILYIIVDTFFSRFFFSRIYFHFFHVYFVIKLLALDVRFHIQRFFLFFLYFIRMLIPPCVLGALNCDFFTKIFSSFCYCPFTQQRTLTTMNNYISCHLIQYLLVAAVLTNKHLLLTYTLTQTLVSSRPALAKPFIVVL